MDENNVKQALAPEETTIKKDKPAVADAGTDQAAPQAGEQRPSRDQRFARDARGGYRGRGDRRGRPGDRRGRRREEPKEYEENVIDINRIAKTVKGGRRMRFSALVAIGDKKGKYGFASAKAAEVPDAIKKAIEGAKKNLAKVQLVKGGTIAHEIIGKFGACRVFLKPAPEGTGIIAGGAVRAMLELAGVRNVYSKIYGSRSPINVVRATHDGLMNLQSESRVRALRKEN